MTQQPDQARGVPRKKDIFLRKDLLSNESIKVTFSTERSKLFRHSYMCLTGQWWLNLNFLGGRVRSSFQSWVWDPHFSRGRLCGPHCWGGDEGQQETSSFASERSEGGRGTWDGGHRSVRSRAQWLVVSSRPLSKTKSWGIPSSGLMTIVCNGNAILGRGPPCHGLF